MLITDVVEIYELIENVREFAEDVASGTSYSEIYYRLRLNSMCLSLK
jgi:hypothetical protein